MTKQSSNPKSAAQNTGVKSSGPKSAVAKSVPTILDVAIIGSGPAALTAALYLSRAGRKVTVFERGAFGGELTKIAKLENYPGFSGSGVEFYKTARAQAEHFGAKFQFGDCEKVKSVAKLPKTTEGFQLSSSQPGFELHIDGEKVLARTILAASGSEPRQLGFEITPPVSYCALCDGALAKDKRVAVVGGGNSAVQESLNLIPLVKSLTLISHSTVKADQALQDRLRAEPKAEILEHVEPTKQLLDQYEYVFVFIGKVPAAKYLEPLREQKNTHKFTKLAKIAKIEVEVIQKYKLFDEQGYVVTGGKKGRSAHAAAFPGVFAAGDVRRDSVKQVVTAAADGAAAAIEITQYLRGC